MQKCALFCTGCESSEWGRALVLHSRAGEQGVEAARSEGVCRFGGSVGSVLKSGTNYRLNGVSSALMWRVATQLR